MNRIHLKGQCHRLRICSAHIVLTSEYVGDCRKLLPILYTCVMEAPVSMEMNAYICIYLLVN